MIVPPPQMMEDIENEDYLKNEDNVKNRDNFKNSTYNGLTFSETFSPRNIWVPDIL